jgi:hypothetical protein
MNAYVKTEILSDGSKVFNLEVYDDADEMIDANCIVAFSCISEECAYDLVKSLKLNTIDFE